MKLEGMEDEAFIMSEGQYMLQEASVCIDRTEGKRKSSMSLIWNVNGWRFGLTRVTVFAQPVYDLQTLGLATRQHKHGMNIPLFSLDNEENSRNSSYDNRNSSYVLWTDRAPSVLPCFCGLGRRSSPSPRRSHLNTRPCKFCTICNPRCETIHARGSVEILACEIGKGSRILA